MTKRQTKRLAVLLPGGVPKMIRCYDNGNRPDGGTCDRYTIVFTGRYRHLTGGEFLYLAASGEPFHPQGFGQHGFSRSQIDRPKYSHLGTPIKFVDLPADVQRFVLGDYLELWSLGPAKV